MIFALTTHHLAAHCRFSLHNETYSLLLPVVVLYLIIIIINRKHRLYDSDNNINRQVHAALLHLPTNTLTFICVAAPTTRTIARASQLTNHSLHSHIQPALCTTSVIDHLCRRIIIIIELHNNLRITIKSIAHIQSIAFRHTTEPLHTASSPDPHPLPVRTIATFQSVEVQIFIPHLLGARHSMQQCVKQCGGSFSGTEESFIA